MAGPSTKSAAVQIVRPPSDAGSAGVSVATGAGGGIAGQTVDQNKGGAGAGAREFTPLSAEKKRGEFDSELSVIHNTPTIHKDR